MKTLFIAVFVACVVCAASVPSPDKSDLQKLKAEAARKKACLQNCGAAKFEPVCAGKGGEKPKSFGNECVLHNHNCEHNDNLTKISKGQCPGSEGIRLS